AAESLALFEAAGDAWGAAHATLSVAMLTPAEGGDGAAQQRLNAALERWRALGDGWGTAETLNLLGDLARGRGEDTAATACYEESLTLLRRHNLAGTVPSLLHNLGWLALRGRGARRALDLFRESMALFQNQGDRRGIAECLDGLAGAMGALRQPERAARLFGTAEGLREAIGAEQTPVNAADYARSLAVARDQLDAAAFAAAWAAGRALPLEQAIEEFLANEPSDRRPAPAGDPAWLELTPREREVTQLIARGMTNRQIGAALVITEGTARLHVKHILQKLGFTSRAQVAAWAVARGLATAQEAQ
ncbi:MAG: LuxR C-terminal-related transcriptional regulator, partial [Dehalococcoidia bacterium]